MRQKKYELDVSPCNNYYINLISELGHQDILDIKKQIPEISLLHLNDIAELINEVFLIEGHADYIIYTDDNKDTSTQSEYLSNNCYISINSEETLGTMKINPNGNIEKIKKEINKTGIVFGVMIEMIEYMLEHKIPEPFIFAKADFPVPVEETNYSFFYDTKRPFPVNIQQGTKGVYLDTTIENRTIIGKPIAKIKKSSNGVSGKTITGLTIPTKIFPKKPLTLGEHVYQKGTEVFPEISGLVNYSSEIIEVIPTLIIKDAVLNQNIEFDGTVIVENMIQNSTIKATHDITIYGTSNSATLEADGHIYLLTGFIGNVSKATAKKDIFCGYSHNSKLTTIEGDIHIGYESLHAILNSGKSIYVEKKVSGGKLFAKENIIIDSSGSERITTKTELNINYDPSIKHISRSDLLQEMQENERKYQKANKELVRYESTSEKSKNMLIKDTTFQQLTSIVFELQEQLKEQLMLLSKHKDSTDDDQTQKRTGIISIMNKAWNGTTININNETFVVDKNANQGSLFRLSSYGIIRERHEQK